MHQASSSKMLLTSNSCSFNSTSQRAMQVWLHRITGSSQRTRTDKCSLAQIRRWMQWRPHNWHCYTANTIRR